MVMNNLRIKIKLLMNGILNERNPQTKFINPYAMSEPVTQQLRVKPEFRDGRFILTPQTEDPLKDNVVPDKQKKQKEPGFSKFIAGVVVSDLEKIASIAKSKPLPVMKAEDAVTHTPPPLELELLEPLEPLFEPQQPTDEQSVYYQTEEVDVNYQKEEFDVKQALARAKVYDENNEEVIL